ncbi:methyltransferase [Pseudodesulfovibrio pelocollis]|uniref:methyltransferase n=1 Tax=Pseudodesulfovibrio pelocollis TaxID=3051432 RepID=UPI00255AC784|nr:methyltransferase [Pseudodesulfovibrio sp. SB368]
MSWRSFQVSSCGTHHLDEGGQPVYSERFDEVLKFHAPGLAPVLRCGLAWHVLSDGTAAYDRRFIRTFGFYEELAAVVAPDGWHHIFADGNNAYTRRHAWCGNFQQGRCAVRDHDGNYFHITPCGKDAYPTRWRYAGDYRDGIAAIQTADGYSTHIELEGSLLHGEWFVDLDVFHKGFARARDEDGWMHVDFQGRPVYARRFQTVEPFYNGQARVERFDGTLEIIDETGASLVELRPARCSEFASLSGDMVGFWRTQTIGTAVELGVFDVLPAAEREVADQCGLHTDGARRLLRALGELDLATRQENQWTLTARGELLQADHPLTLADAAVEYAGPFTVMWGRLPDALRKSTCWTAPDVFGEVARDDSRRLGHHRMLRSYARHDYAEVCRALDLCGDERLIDAGGGLGVLAQLILDAHPSVYITVLERPEVVAMAPSASRVCWRSGNLFEPWEIEADAVVLSRVLHDWNDTEAMQILRHARAALPRHGRLFIVEMLLLDQSVSGALCDLHLLMATGGRERSAEHFGRLLAATGFEFAAVRRLTALPSVIVGVAS